MTNHIVNTNAGEKKPFVKPELKILDVKNTETGSVLDPNEFNPILQAS